MGQRRRRSETPQAVTPPHDAIPKQRGQARHSMMTRPHSTTNRRDTSPDEAGGTRGAALGQCGERRAAPDAAAAEPTHPTGTAPARAPRGKAMKTEKDSHGDGAGDATRRQQRTARECGPSVQTARKVGVGDTATRRHPSRRKRFEKTCDDRERNAARMESPNVQVQGTLRGFIAQRPLERRVRPHTYALREWRATY